MLIEITGLPGNGKTLYALQYVKDWAARENRPVFYSGIADLKLPWTEIEPEKWAECPPNSIIVIDECQRVFRPRSSGKEVPVHVSGLETHRHQGLDIVLITQHPLLTDTAVRRLVGKHFHVVRKFGMQAATIHEWAGVKETCDKPSGRVDSIKHHWVYPKAVFEFYKSAEVHTVKRSVPMRVYLFVLVPVLLIAAVWYMYGWTKKKTEVPVSLPVSGSSIGAIAAPAARSPGAPGKVSFNDALPDAQQFVFDRTERVAGLAQTAPRYDEVTKPVSAPMPSACVSSRDRCSCYSQQATVLNVPESMCREIVKAGFFVDFDDSKHGIAGGSIDDRSVRSQAVLHRDTPLPLSGAVTSDVPARNAADGYGILGRRDSVRLPGVDVASKG